MTRRRADRRHYATSELVLLTGSVAGCSDWGPSALLRIGPMHPPTRVIALLVCVLASACSRSEQAATERTSQQRSECLATLSSPLWDPAEPAGVSEAFKSIPPTRLAVINTNRGVLAIWNGDPPGIESSQGPVSASETSEALALIKSWAADANVLVDLSPAEGECLPADR